MKTLIIAAGLLGLVGCTSTPQQVKMSPVMRTFTAEAPYKMLSECVQQRLQNEAGSWAEMRLTFQDWVPSAELTYLQRINLAGSVETVYVTTLQPEGPQTTRLSVQMNEGLFNSAVQNNLSNLDNEVKACTALINASA